MNADKWIFPLALCFICASSNDEQHFEKSCGQYPYLCERHIVSTPLGSSVLLPCNFTTNGLGWVSWVHASGENLLRLKADGHVQFMLPKEGRVKVFPNQGSRGNYPIRIDELQDSDLGCYRCLQGDKCHQVDLHVSTDTLSKETWGLIYICVGVVTFVLLGVCTYFLHKKMTQDSTNNIVCVHIEEADNHSLVYENDDQDPANQQGDPKINYCSTVGLPDLYRPQTTQSTVYPNLNQFNFEMVESERTTHRFQREIHDRSGKSCFTQHDYVNQEEISNQQTMSASLENHERGMTGFRKKKAKANREYKNPIYNRSQEQLNL
ncbi:uncharacterized protein LOC117772343 isoform X3 [Hippoglossus hippoglossus]|uniref:uncharacterized protein LOC117772343 isoform X3 n=1 Tax=Hippoglossus hippoglossus TaxID=8267 RepID=UPI00148E63EA|nr:uncharacterized protein LOC117772343 isoform X3 [Hippoglossus hippoglossus]